MVRQRLEDSPSQILCGQAATLATKLMRSPAYQSGKKELLSMVETGEPMELPIPSLPTDISCEESKIQEGKMIVSGYALQRLKTSEIRSNTSSSLFYPTPSPYLNVARG